MENEEQEDTIERVQLELKETIVKSFKMEELFDIEKKKMEEETNQLLI